MKPWKRILAPLPMLILAAGCAGGDFGSSNDPYASVDPASFAAAKGDRWDERNDPRLFSDDLEYRFDALPLEGVPDQIPWPGTYWPTYIDSINQRWDGPDTASPAAKYGKAFGVDEIEDIVSSYYGVDAHTDRTECTSASDCSEPGDGTCAKRRGEEKGYCIETWWGICHAWAPAAIMEPEPVDAVTRNGVEFKVNDLKALMSLHYDRSESKFLSMRCNERGYGKDAMDFDEYGNPAPSECKDTNAGTFHVVATNYLGLMGKSFVEDKTYDIQVWNQPVAGYRTKQVEQVSVAKAHELLKVPFVAGRDAVVHEFQGALAVDAWFESGSYFIPSGSPVRVTMSASANADLYVRFGEAPTKDDYDCRPKKSSNLTEVCDFPVSEEDRQIFISIVGQDDDEDAQFNTKLVIAEEQAEEPTEYVFNRDAEELYHIKMEFDYITESSAGTDGNLANDIDRYINTDSYEYIVEVDAHGEVIGGEWVGSSKKRHPDFLWLPTGRGKTPTAGGTISYAMVKSLLKESIGESAPMAVLQDVEEAKVDRGRVAVFGPYEVDGDVFEVSMVGNGDADLYIRRNEPPTGQDYDCRPYMDGSHETCSLEGEGTYYVVVYGMNASEFRLNITYTTTDLSLAPVVEEEVAESTEEVEVNEVVENSETVESPETEEVEEVDGPATEEAPVPVDAPSEN